MFLTKKKLKKGQSVLSAKPGEWRPTLADCTFESLPNGNLEALETSFIFFYRQRTKIPLKYTGSIQNTQEGDKRMKKHKPTQSLQKEDYA